MSAKGQGVDVASRKTVAALNASLEKAQYGHWDISGVDVHAGLKSSVALPSVLPAIMSSQDAGNADMRLDQLSDGALDLNVKR